MKCSRIITIDKSDVHAKGQGQKSKIKVTEVKPNLAISGLQLQFEYDDEMMQKASWCLGEVPYCFSRSSIKFQGHTAKKIILFYPN